MMSFHEMRRSDRALSEVQAMEVLLRGEYGVLSTVDSEGCPYGVPLNYVCLNGKLYFHCAPDVGHKLANLAENDRVCFTLVTRSILLPEKFSTDYESVIVFGRAAQVTGEEKQAALEGMIRRLSPDYIDKGMAYVQASQHRAAVYAITPERITGKARKRKSE